MSEPTPDTVAALRAENAALLAQLQELRDSRAAAVRSMEDAAAETAAVFAALLDAVLVYDADMQVVRVNPRFRAVYGFDPVGLHVTEIIARTQCRRADGSPLALESQPTPRALHGEPVLNQQFRITRLDGQERFLETSAMPLRIGGRIAGSVTVWHDITERMLAETALRKSEEHYRLLADNVDDFVSLEDAAGHHLYVSPSYFRVTGWTPAELETIPWRERMHPDDLPELERAKAAVAQGEHMVCEHRIRCRDGQWIWVVQHFKPLLDAEGRVQQIVLWAHNITERKAAELALREGAARYRLLGETMWQGVVHQDAAGQIIAMNPAAERILGWTHEEYLGRTSVQVERACIRENGEIFPGAEHPAMVALRTGVPQRGVIMGVFNQKLGAYRWISIDAVPIGKPGAPQPAEVYAIFADITERKAAAEALQESEARARALIQHAPTGIYEISFDGSRFISVNDVICEWSGYSREELMAMNPLAITDDAGRAGFRERVVRKLSGKNVVEPLELKIVGKQGRERIVLLTTGVFSLKDGRPESVQVIAHDITERKATESALRDSEARFRDMFERHNAVKLVIEPESGKIMDANPAAARFYGYTRERLCQLRIQDLNQLPPELVAAERQQAAAEQRNYFVFPHRLASGEVRWVEVYTSPVETRGRALLYAIIHDITARKQAEQAIAQSIALLKSAGFVQTAPDPTDGRKTCISITDAASRLHASIIASRTAWLAHAIDTTIDAEERAALATTVDLLERLAEAD